MEERRRDFMDEDTARRQVEVPLLADAECADGGLESGINRDTSSCCGKRCIKMITSSLLFVFTLSIVLVVGIAVALQNTSNTAGLEIVQLNITGFSETSFTVEVKFIFFHGGIMCDEW